VFASLTAFGIIVKIVASAKKYNKKIERANFARTEYKKIMDAIRFCLRGEPFSEKEFLDNLKMIDDFVSDHCMEIPTQINKKYSQCFTAL